MDLAVLGNLASAVTILPGNGDGTFKPRSDYRTGANPFSLAIGDLNADGQPDLVVANRSGNSVAVLMAIGAGMFAPKIELGVDKGTISAVIADLDGDGKLDLAAANQLANNVAILHSAGCASTAVGDPPAVPRLALLDTWPNPFRRDVNIRFVLPEVGRVQADVFDVSGRKVVTLARDSAVRAGEHTIQWSGRTAAGTRLPAGVYLVRIRTGGQVVSAPVIHLN